MQRVEVFHFTSVINSYPSRGAGVPTENMNIAEASQNINHKAAKIVEIPGSIKTIILAYTYLAVVLNTAMPTLTAL